MAAMVGQMAARTMSLVSMGVAAAKNSAFAVEIAAVSAVFLLTAASRRPPSSAAAAAVAQWKEYAKACAEHHLHGGDAASGSSGGEPIADVAVVGLDGDVNSAVHACKERGFVVVSVAADAGKHNIILALSSLLLAKLCAELDHHQHSGTFAALGTRGRRQVLHAAIDVLRRCQLTCRAVVPLHDAAPLLVAADPSAAFSPLRTEEYFGAAVATALACSHALTETCLLPAAVIGGMVMFLRWHYRSTPYLGEATVAVLLPLLASAALVWWRQRQAYLALCWPEPTTDPVTAPTAIGLHMVLVTAVLAVPGAMVAHAYMHHTDVGSDNLFSWRLRAVVYSLVVTQMLWHRLTARVTPTALLVDRGGWGGKSAVAVAAMHRSLHLPPFDHAPLLAHTTFLVVLTVCFTQHCVLLPVLALPVGRALFCDGHTSLLRTARPSPTLPCTAAAWTLYGEIAVAVGVVANAALYLLQHGNDVVIQPPVAGWPSTAVRSYPLALAAGAWAVLRQSGVLDWLVGTLSGETIRTAVKREEVVAEARIRRAAAARGRWAEATAGGAGGGDPSPGARRRSLSTIPAPPHPHHTTHSHHHIPRTDGPATAPPAYPPDVSWAPHPTTFLLLALAPALGTYTGLPMVVTLPLALAVCSFYFCKWERMRHRKVRYTIPRLTMCPPLALTERFDLLCSSNCNSCSSCRRRPSSGRPTPL